MWSSVGELVTSVVAQADGLGSPVDAARARQLAEEILSRAEYTEPPESFIDRILGWIGEQLGNILLDQSTSATGQFVSYALVGGLIAFAIWVVAKAFRSPGRASVRATDTVIYGTENVRGPDVWQAEADRLAGIGDFRGALRCRHQALIAAWIVDGVIEHVVGQTAQECHAAAAEEIDLDGEVSRRIVTRFDTVWYGGADVDRDDYARFADDCGGLAAAVRGRRTGVGA